MRYARVALGLPLDRLFDYEIPEELRAQAAAGCRVWVNFRGKKSVAYIGSTCRSSSFPKIKPLLSVIDQKPLLSPLLLELTKKLAAYYSCSWGEMIEAALPERLRRGEPVESPGGEPANADTSGRVAPEVTVLLCPDAGRRRENYFTYISGALADGRQSIVLVPDAVSVPRWAALIRERFPQTAVGELFRKQPAEAAEWQKTRLGAYSIIVGTRSAVFAPLAHLGLVIMEDEQDHGYKQEQAPHYHARTAALERAGLEGSRLVFGSAAPSLELARMCREGRARLEIIPAAFKPEVKAIDISRLPHAGVKNKIRLSRFLEDAILSAILAGEKVLVFLNRKGFATGAACSTCGASLKCPRCSTNLVYYFREQSLACNYCAFRMPVPRMCPQCNSGYIKFSGSGTEKVESELARIFPAARIKLLSGEDAFDPADADIFVSTQSVLSRGGAFDLTAVLALDSSLNHADFRAGEKVFGLLSGLAGITRRRLLIQTAVPEHYCVRAVEKGDAEVFYKQEMELRRQLGFPPFRHFCLVKCRGASDEKTGQAAQEVFKLISSAKGRGIRAVSVNPAQPERLRGKYHWQALITGSDPVKLSRTIKNCLKDFRRTGIIVTVDVDPQ